MFKKSLAIVMACVLLAVSLTGCKSTKESNVAQIEYKPEEEIKAFNLPEIPEADKDFAISMGYNDCDHMVGAIIGEKAGIYKALGLNVTITKTKNSNIAQAMSTGEMHAGYMGIEGAIRSANEGAPVMMAAANHVGGSRYLVISNKIEDVKDLVGKKLAIGKNSENSPEWITWADELGIPVETSNYEVIEMGMKDGPLALQSGQIDGFATCDPYASMCEYAGYGKVAAVGWGGHITEDRDGGWGMCCIYGMNANFAKEHPELAQRMMVAHALSIRYMYEHPYNASMMFAEGFGTQPEVGLMTMYMKTVAEGRTITWEFTQENLDNYFNRFKEFNIDPKFIPKIENVEKFVSTNIMKDSGVGSFKDYIASSKIDEKFPISMSFEEWLKKAKEIDGITSDIGNDIKMPEIYTN